MSSTAHGTRDTDCVFMLPPSAVSVSAETLREVVDQQVDAVALLQCVREPSQGNDVIDFIFALTNPAADVILCTGVRQGMQVCKTSCQPLPPPRIKCGKTELQDVVSAAFLSHRGFTNVRVLCRWFVVFFFSQVLSCCNSSVFFPSFVFSTKKGDVDFQSQQSSLTHPTSILASDHGPPPLRPFPAAQGYGRCVLGVP